MMNYQKAKFIQGINPTFLTRRNLEVHQEPNVNFSGPSAVIEADWIVQNGYAFEREQNGKFRIRGPVSEIFGKGIEVADGASKEAAKLHVIISF